MSLISGGQAVVEVLKAEGVKFVFGLPGAHTISIYDALYDAKEIRHILVRHEQLAANMAAAYAILTGEPGICWKHYIVPCRHTAGAMLPFSPQKGRGMQLSSHASECWRDTGTSSLSAATGPSTSV